MSIQPAGKHPKKKCGAKTRTGGRCAQWALANGRCRYHGGNARRGADSPRFKHGRYSKYLPPALADRMEVARNDEDLLNQRESIALLDARLSILLEQQHGSADWKAAKQALDELASAGNDRTKLTNALSQLKAIIETGLSETSLWLEVAVLLDNRRKIVESERKRLVELQQILTVDQALNFAAAIIGLVNANVTDTKARVAIIEGTQRFLSVQQQTGQIASG